MGSRIPLYDQYNSHGTCTAGIIAEVQNNDGGVGVAYNAKIIPIRLGTVDPPNVNPNGYITTNDTWESNCFTYAVANGADIISNSWGGGSTSVQLDAAITNAVTNGRNYKGAIVLFAAGNNNTSVNYPASNSNVIAIGASSQCDTRKRSSNNSALLNPGVYPDPLNVSCDGEYWWGSNYGTGLDVIAPGVNITTTTLTTLGSYVNNFNGTSAACPNAAAVCALILSVNPNLTGQQVRKILESNCDKVGGYTYQSNVSGQPNGTWCAEAGYGRVNAFAAVQAAQASIPTITGPSTVCYEGSYFSINYTPGSDVYWTVSNPSLFYVYPSPGNYTSVHRIGSSYGSATLEAHIGSPSGKVIASTT